MIWIFYTLIILLVSGLVGFHLGRFREAYTEMTGMMAGMTMGMLNGFLLGYAAAALTADLAGVTATVSLFWGNLFGILLGVLLGAFFGRAGGLMGIMDGGMGGVMGGSMGAMLAAMLTFPAWALLFTAVILLVVYIASMFGLVVLIERSAPGHAALHVLAPYFTRAVATEAAEEHSAHHAAHGSHQASPADHYSFLGVRRDATAAQITEAYVARASRASAPEAERAERALIVLTDPARRAAYDRTLLPERKRSQALAQTGQVRQGQSRAERTLRSVPVQAPRKGPGPGTIIGGLSVLVVGGMLAWFLLSGGQMLGGGGAQGYSAVTDNGKPLSVDFIDQLQTKAVAANLSNGKQNLDLAVNGDTRGYSPYAIKVKQGVPVHINLSVQGADPG